MTTSADIRTFYDEFQTRLVRDYVFGNPRVSKAIKFVSSVITPSTRTVLDIGCGIGTTSSRYAARHTRIEVVGVDISPKNIDTASRLFASDRVRFLESEVNTTPPGGPYDVVAMIDVYEHIRVDHRADFHRSIAAAMGESGVLVLTTPSRWHQEWLAENKPEGLQIVDEIIDREEVEQFADAVDGVLIQFAPIDVWDKGDYCCTIISRDGGFEPKASFASRPRLISPGMSVRLGNLYSRIFDSGAIRRRQHHVRQALGMDVQRDQSARDQDLSSPALD